MTGPNSVRCVCFDWGGVLLRICRSFAEGVRAAGLELRPGADAPEMAAKRHELAHQFQIGGLQRLPVRQSATLAVVA